MKRYWRFFLAFPMVFVVLCVLARAGWSEVGEGRKPASFQETQDPLVSSSALRWRQGLPNHWRACMLQH